MTAVRFNAARLLYILLQLFISVLSKFSTAEVRYNRLLPNKPQHEYLVKNDPYEMVAAVSNQN